MQGEVGVTQSIIDELHSWDIEGDEMEGGSGVTRSINNELCSWVILEIKWKVKVVLIEVSLMNIIIRFSKEIKWKVKVVLLEVSLMNFILGRSN